MSSDNSASFRPPVRVRTRVRPVVETAPSSVPVTACDSDFDDPAPDYAVGYKRPPMHSRWQKGQSGNPRGPKKRVKSLHTIVREVMTEPVKIRTGGREQVMSRAQALVLKTVEAASKGNDRALDKLLRLFAAAMPDDGGGMAIAANEQPLSATDEATLQAIRDLIAAEIDAESKR